MSRTMKLLTQLGCLALMTANLCLSAQAPEQHFMAQLSRFPGNKLLLIGTWSAQEKVTWNKLLDEEGIFEFDITVLETTGTEIQPAMGRFDPAEFNKWLNDRYALRGSRWLLLDATNEAIAQGNSAITSEEFISRLERAGLISPVKQLRNFLRIYPDHLDARLDLFKQLRRRAIKLQSAEIKQNSGKQEQLGPEADLTIWASLAQEVDTAFQSNWRGIEMPFFRAEEEDQAEQYSPIMKSVFARHIAKVEVALQEAPTSQSYWNVWAWMARSLENRDWKGLLKSLDAFTYPGGHTCPAPNVAVWLTREARAIGDWEQVVRLAKSGVGFNRYPSEGERGWFPGGGMMVVSMQDTRIEGYPTDSSLIPMLEGLLRLNRLEEASAVFEDVLFFGGAEKRETMVNLAQSLGHTYMAQDWRTKAQDDSVQRYNTSSINTGPFIIMHNVREAIPQFLYKIQNYFSSSYSLGWPQNETRWALFDERNRLVAEGEGTPKEELIFEALKKKGYKTPGELARDYLRNHPDNAFAQYVLAHDFLIDARSKMDSSNLDANEMLDDDLDYDLYGECAKNFRAYFEKESALNRPNNSVSMLYYATNSNLMRAAAKAILPKLEAALKQRPMSESIWGAWTIWRRVDGDVRPFTPLLESLVPSPLVGPGSFPPTSVMNTYYSECINQERWAEAAKLLRQPWERELASLDSRNRRDGGNYYFAGDTWTIGKLLISALLHDGKLRDAEDVVDAWTSRGGKFENVTDIIELAKKLEYESLADRWKRMVQ
ncbi:MAG: hypothetical protein FWG12_02415 [Holophagaceae bacterium]|nr:hypothetical protein [Holophagaceae bacterium]